VNSSLSLRRGCALITSYNRELFLPSVIVEAADEVVNGVNELLFFLDVDRAPGDNFTFVKVRQIDD
jgi:hypothetical protein